MNFNIFIIFHVVGSQPVFCSIYEDPPVKKSRLSTTDSAYSSGSSNFSSAPASPLNDSVVEENIPDPEVLEKYPLGYTIGKEVFVAPSILPGGGSGLFTGVDIKKNQVITAYSGQLIRPHENERELLRNTYPHWSHLHSSGSRQILIQGLQKPVYGGFGGGSFTNDNYPRPANAEYLQYDDPDKGSSELVIKAITPIPKGQEIFVRYGSTYWQRFKDEMPTVYEDIRGEGLFGNAYQKFLKSPLFDSREVLDFFSERALPTWAELKSDPSEWTEDLSTYALMRFGLLDESFITPAILKMIKSDTRHYFFQIGQYIAKKTTGDAVAVAETMNNTALDLPVSEIFNQEFYRKSANQWQPELINFFFKLFSQERYPDDASQGILGILDAEGRFYEQVMTEHMFSELSVDYGRTFDWNNTIKKVKRLQRQLTKDGLPIPSEVGYLSFEHDRWSRKAIHDFLERKAVLINSGCSSDDPLNNRLLSVRRPDDTEVYYSREIEPGRIILLMMVSKLKEKHYLGPNGGDARSLRRAERARRAEVARYAAFKRAH